ncbi:SurA N-terminal domain-containing protein, partial [Flavobacteriales bacterium]|nr:SurA N-terminal domain-containing protein [Flavobacteriales bacterium]
MALIGKIRSNQKILIVFIGLAMVLFVVDPQTLFGGGSRGEQPIGEIFGEQIMDSDWKYDNRVEVASYNYRGQKQQYGQDPILTEQESEQIKNQVWSQMILDTLYGVELEKLGLAVSPGELNESLLYGMKPATFLQSQFSYGTMNPQTGQEENKVFVRDSLIKRLNLLINGSNLENKQQLKSLEDQLTKERIREKYIGMVKYGLTGTTEDANRNYAEAGTSASVSYIYKGFESVPDSVINITEEELKAYYDEHRSEKKWKQEVEMRSFNYVTFDVLPSNRDMNAAIARLDKDKGSFQTSQNDSMFVTNNSYSYNNGTSNISQVLPNGPYEGGDYPIETDNQILSASQGDVVGPFTNGQEVLMVKIRETGTREEVTAKNIFISTNGMDNKVKLKKRKTLDSLFRIIKLDTSKFSELASIYSDDIVSKYNNAKHDWFPKGKIHANTKFESFCFEKPIGSFEIVETENGLHIVQLLGRETREFQLIAICDTKVTASKATSDSIYDAIGSPLYYSIKENGYENAIEEAGLISMEAKNVRIDYPQMGTLPKSMSILKWAFNSEIGATMEAELIEGNTKYVVAYLTEAIHEGDPEFESVKSMMKPEVLKEKKAEYISNELAGSISLEDAATKIGETLAQAELTLSMNSFPAVPDNNPGVIGEVFALNKDELSG